MDEASVTIEAAPEQVWALVSDITKMGRFSDSNTGGKWIMGASGPEVGARFVGFNRRGVARWLTTCKVNENKMQWGWRVEPAEGGGTLLTQWRNRVGQPAKPVLFVANLLFKGR